MFSYSTMPNMKKIITGHNRKITDPRSDLKPEECNRKGNCKEDCFEEGEKCQTRCTIYQATLKYEKGETPPSNSSSEDSSGKGLYGTDKFHDEGEVQPSQVDFHQ